MFCQYKNIFGQPGQGFHNHFGTPVAIGDLVATMGIAYFISRRYKYPYLKTFAGTMLVAITVHKMFCVDTALNNFLFG